MKNPSMHNQEVMLPPATALPFHFLSNLLDAQADVICALDQSGYCRYINKACLTLWGYGQDELIGTCICDIWVKDDNWESCTSLLLSSSHLGTVAFTNRIYNKDGSMAIVQWSGGWEEERGLYYYTAKDGTALKDYEVRLEKAQMLAKVANFEFDLVHQVYTYTSNSLYSIFGVDRQKHPIFTPELFWNAIHPDDLEYVRTNMLQPEHMYKPALEYRIVRPDGEVVYIKRLRDIIRNREGRPVKTIGTILDITDRKKTELALRQSGQRLKALVENGSDLICIVDTNGYYVYVAESVRQILGYDPDCLIGRSAFEFIHPDDLENAATALSQIISSKYVTIIPFRFKNLAGEWRRLEAKVANFADDPAINGLIVNSRDITEEKSRVDKIRELSLIAEKSQHAIMLSDVQHQITWVNQAFMDLSEYTLQDVLGKKPQDIFTSPEVSEEQHKELQQDLSISQSITREMLFYSKSGRKYWMELQVQPVFGDDGAFIQYLAMGQDITERKNINARLALSEQRFKALVQNGSDLIVIVDEKGILQYVSDNVRCLLNYEPENLIGKSAFDLIPEEERPLVWAELQKVLKNGHLTKGIQHRFQKADGSWVWLETKGTNHIDNKSVNGVLINARDVSERVMLQQQLNNELRCRQKEITTAVINAQEQERSQLGLELHDNVNQVLTTVKLYNEMYLSGYNQEKDLIKKSTVYLQDCINEIRSISKRLSAPTLGHISLRDSIQELIESLILTRQIELLFRPYNIDNLSISQELHLTIYRIVQEGLNNIIKYAEAKTAIVSIRQWEATLNVTIYDDGKGFDTNLKRSGIGITNMRTRAENMNGTFEINSTPGNGCSLKMVFPLHNH